MNNTDGVNVFGVTLGNSLLVDALLNNTDEWLNQKAGSCPGNAKCWTFDQATNTCYMEESCYTLKCADAKMELSFSKDLFRIDGLNQNPWLKVWLVQID